jgi:hypothetical protein
MPIRDVRLSATRAQCNGKHFPRPQQCPRSAFRRRRSSHFFAFGTGLFLASFLAV